MIVIYFVTLSNCCVFFLPDVGEVNRLELELQRVQKENLKNEVLHNFSEKEDYTSNGETKPEDYVNKLEAEIQSLKSKFAYLTH